jgi:DNA-binding response OmpR family regulator
VRILLLDHDGGDAGEVLGALKRANFEVKAASSWEEETGSAREAFEAVLLGTRGPLQERADHCRKLREDGYAGGILALSSDASEGEMLLDAGADDFLTPPHAAFELATRLRACVRRVASRGTLRWGPIELDRVRGVLGVGGKSVPLTDRECDLLACLIEAGGRAVSRAKLREQVWHQTGSRGSNLVEVHISRLRDKLGDSAGLIETVWRAGYRLKR